MKHLKVRFSSHEDVDFLELGVPLELFRRKRALDHEDCKLHFNEKTLRMLRHSNAHMLVDSPFKDE